MTRSDNVNPASARWHVFYTRARAEKKCERLLDERQIEVFLPKRAVTRQWKDRRKKIIEPLFPNYIFAHVDEKGRLRVLKTPGVVRCVAFGKQLAIVSSEEMGQLRLLQEKPDWLEPATALLPDRGTIVTIEDGPLLGLKGNVIAHRGEFRIVVQIPSIKQAVKVIVPASAVSIA